MCQHCTATNRLVRRMEKLSNLTPQHSCVNPPGSDDLSKIMTVLSENSDQVAQDASFIAFHTGMTMREIAALKSADIDFDQLSMSIPSRTYKYSRTIQMSESVADLLKKRQAESGGSGKIFFDGHRSLVCKVNRALRSACVTAGIPVISAKALRGAFAMKLANADVSPLQLKTLAAACAESIELTLGGKHTGRV